MINKNIYELTEDEMYNFLTSEHKLTECELKDIVYNQLFYHDSQEFDSGRWSQRMLYIMKVCNQLFAIPWDKGLTEMQDNEFVHQPYKVVCKEKIITVKEYVREE